MAFALRFRAIFCCFLSSILTNLEPTSSLTHRVASSFSTSQNRDYWFSNNGIYTFGFQELNPNQYILSVYSQGLSRTAIWWAQIGQDSILDAGAALNFTNEGNLELLNSKGAVVWSSNTSNLGVTSAELLDTGNLELRNDKQNITCWQSLQILTDTLMLPSEGSQYTGPSLQSRAPLLQSRKSNTSYVPGIFHLDVDEKKNLYLHGVDKRGNDLIYFYAQINDTVNVQIRQDTGVLFDSGELSGDPSLVRRLTLDADGNLRVYSLGQNSSSWQVMWAAISNPCQLNSPCGPFGLCEEDTVSGSINCSCPPGYHATNKTDISQGCAADIPFNFSLCGDPNYYYNATMMEVADHDFMYNDFPQSSTGALSANECKMECLKACACMAASYRKDGTCFLKGNSDTGTGYLSDGYYTINNNLYIKAVTEVYNYTSGGEAGASKVEEGIGVTAAVVVVLLAAMAVGYCWYVRRRKRRRGEAQGVEQEGEEEVYGGGTVRFTYEELVEATGNFSEVLGEGGFGKVYKGWVTKKDGGSGQTVAVKMLKGGGGAEEGRQFRAEVGTLGKIHHINLVSLVGFCTGRGRRLLVYEYMANGSLDKFLPTTGANSSGVSSSTSAAISSSTSSSSSTTRFLPQTPALPPPLPWHIRFSIALGTARGLSYLHHDCHQRILHCDVKPQNILLDDNFCPKLADFGFASLFHHREEHVAMSAVRGTRGYMAPEWLGSDEVTEKVDVYSFGIVLFELVRGNTKLDRLKLCDWAYRKVAVRQREAVMAEYRQEEEERRHEEREEKEMVLKIGLWCIQRQLALRPAMHRVVQMLEKVIAVDDPPYPVPLNTFPSFAYSSSSASSAPPSATSDPSFTTVSAR